MDQNCHLGNGTAERGELLQDNLGAALGASRWEDTSLWGSRMCFCCLVAAVFVPGMQDGELRTLLNPSLSQAF